MDLNTLIEDGKRIVNQSKKQGIYGIEYIAGQEFENWLALSNRYLENNFPNDFQTEKYKELSSKIKGQESNIEQLFGILEALKQLPPVTPKPDIQNILDNILNNFYKFDLNIKRRHGDRETLKINDEYDVQDSLLAILKLFVDDIRPEDYVPSYAGANSRVDFLLPDYGIVIEVKMTNKNLTDKVLGEQLIIDFKRYEGLTDYNHLICFIYDKEGLIKNPYGLKKDLEKMSTSEMNLTVYITPI